MDPSDVWLLIVLVILLYLSSFFSSAETALTTANRHRLRSLAENGNRNADLVLRMLEDQSRMLTTILIGNNIVNLSASSLVTLLAHKIGGSAAVGLGTGILTLVVLIFGEISPKTIATIRSEKMALQYAPIVHWLMILMTPIIFIVNSLSNLCLRILRVNPAEKGEVITEEELRTIVEVSHEEGVLETEEKKMINNVFDLGDSQARDVMVPRVDVLFVQIDTPYKELLQLFRKEHYTRMPVYEDTTDNVIGILNMKDLVLYDQSTPFSIKHFMREAFYTHEYKNTNELFHEMRKASTTMAIVLDEYGTTVGIITIEDILEEIVGDIRDEFDASELEAVQKLDENIYLVEGSYRIDDLNEDLGINLTSEEYDSIGGYFIGLLDHIPDTGEQITSPDGYHFIAAKVKGNRIEKIRLILPPKPEEEPEEENSDTAHSLIFHRDGGKSESEA